MNGLVGVVLEVWIGKGAVDFGLIDNWPGRRAFAAGVEMPAYELLIQKSVDVPLSAGLDAVHHSKNWHQRTANIFEEDLLQNGRSSIPLVPVVPPGLIVMKRTWGCWRAIAPIQCAPTSLM